MVFSTMWLELTSNLRKNHRVGEGLGEALVVDHRAINSKGCSAFVFIVEDRLREELFEAGDVFVSDVVPE